jgi:ribose/xylose/arabinose/galactoside ABC-type transport system permease subunit
MVYVISGAMCGVAASLFAYQIAAAHPQVGSAYLLDSIAAPVIGGVNMSGGQGSVLGAFGGGLLIAMLSNAMVIAGVNPFIEEAAKGAIILAYIIAVQPGSLVLLEYGAKQLRGTTEE